MKSFKFLGFALLFLVACTTDLDDINTASSGQIESTANMVGKNEHKKANRPFKVEFYTTVDTDPSIPPTPCTGDLPGLANAGYFLHGTASHIGEIKPEQSRGQDVTCDLSFATFLLTITVAGQIAAANGDLIYYTGNDEINVFNLLTGSGTTGAITGVWTITGGTGRFEGATGSFAIDGYVDFTTLTLSFTGEGTINY